MNWASSRFKEVSSWLDKLSSCRKLTGLSQLAFWKYRFWVLKLFHSLFWNNVPFSWYLSVSFSHIVNSHYIHSSCKVHSCHSMMNLKRMERGFGCLSNLEYQFVDPADPRFFPRDHDHSLNTFSHPYGFQLSDSFCWFSMFHLSFEPSNWYFFHYCMALIKVLLDEWKRLQNQVHHHSEGGLLLRSMSSHQYSNIFVRHFPSLKSFLHSLFQAKPALRSSWTIQMEIIQPWKA